MNIFLKCLDVVLKHEGGYVNDPVDPGGETNMGICKKYFPDEDIKNMTRIRAQEIYFNHYWKPMRLEGIKDPEVVLQIFDHGVNAGTTRSIKMAQAIVRVTRDGICGPKTTAAINNKDGFLDLFVKARIRYYFNLVKRKPVLGRFLIGWVNRVATTRIYD